MGGWERLRSGDKAGDKENQAHSCLQSCSSLQHLLILYSVSFQQGPADE